MRYVIVVLALFLVTGCQHESVPPSVAPVVKVAVAPTHVPVPTVAPRVAAPIREEAQHRVIYETVAPELAPGSRRRSRSRGTATVRRDEPVAEAPQEAPSEGANVIMRSVQMVRNSNNTDELNQMNEAFEKMSSDFGDSENNAREAGRDFERLLAYHMKMGMMGAAIAATQKSQLISSLDARNRGVAGQDTGSIQMARNNMNDGFGMARREAAQAAAAERQLDAG